LSRLNAALPLHLGWYSFARIQQSLRVTPAVAAGVTNYIFEVDDSPGEGKYSEDVA
jgi:hypothetical protein